MLSVSENHIVAEVAELADAQASGACGHFDREGSSPFFRIETPV